MRDLKAELELMNEKNPPFRTNFDYRDMVQRCLKAEAEVERLRGEVISLTIANCRLITISLYDGLGKPELIDGKCFGYAGNMDEPHIDCQYCKAFYGREEE